MRPDELEATERAKLCGFYIRSGRTMHALRTWIAWCRANGRPAVVVAKGPRDAFVEVDGVKLWAGPVEEAESRAAAVAVDTIASMTKQHI